MIEKSPDTVGCLSPSTIGSRQLEDGSCRSKADLSVGPLGTGPATSAEILVGRVSALGINALAADETVVLIEIGPRGPEIFRELCGAGPKAENADRVGWLLVDASIAEDADAAVNALAALLPRFPELHRDFRKERGS